MTKKLRIIRNKKGDIEVRNTSVEKQEPTPLFVAFNELSRKKK